MIKLALFVRQVILHQEAVFSVSLATRWLKVLAHIQGILTALILMRMGHAYFVPLDSL